jgi:metallo-beta-lactamase class B
VQLPESVKDAKLEVLDSTGRVQLKSKVRAGQVVDVSRLAKGAYFLRLTAGKLSGTQSLLKE